MSTVGVGFDLVDVERFAVLMRRRPHVLDRLFSTRERREGRDQPERMAARFAAKEATWKALGVGLGAAPLRDVEVQRTPSGEALLVLYGTAAQLARDRGIEQWHLSLSHSAKSAGAVVVASSS